MQAGQQLTFGFYRFAPQTGQLWRGKQEVRLVPKGVAVLRYLLERPGQVVTKEELLAAAWSDTVVSDAALTTCIQELRQALHDNARHPRYIETVHRRGFRFIGKIVSDQWSVVSREEANHKATGKKQKAKIEDFFPTPNSQSPTPSFVGREAELTQLQQWLAKALHGERQLVFVTGEPGIGKTTLIAVFRQSLASSIQSPELGQQKPSSTVRLLAPRRQAPDTVPWLSRGQCIEHYGAGEAYLPILEALGRLCRDTTGNSVIPLLRQHAPSWLVQLPSVLSPTELEELQRRTAGVTRERMLRELAEALEVITAERPLVLILEDLHWSDVSSLDWLASVARRQERARLLIVGTYRPIEVLTRDHPLKGVKQELQLHGQCEELALDFLSEAAVREYLAVRFDTRPPHPAPLPQGEREPFVAESVHKLAHVIHQRTDGNPLFMVNVTNELVTRKVITQRDGQWEVQGTFADNNLGVPQNLRQLITQQLARVSVDERHILEAASVAGTEFSAAAVAAGVKQSTEEVETVCDNLVRREQFLRAQGTSEWPDGTVAARYGFGHALYQEVLYEQLSATRRSRLHRQIGEREEQAFGERAREIAAELAVHFERGRDYQRAIQYLQQAGENAVRRSAYQEAITLLTKGLELLKTLPDTPERAQQELTLQLALCAALTVVKGYAAPEVEKTILRARALCQQIVEPPQLFQVLWRQVVFYFNRGELQTAREPAEQMLQLAQSVQDPYLLSLAHPQVGGLMYWRGELSSARTHMEQAIALYDPQKHPRRSGNPCDLRVECLSYVSWTLWGLGYSDQALKRSQEAVALAEGLAHPFSLAYALGCAALFHLLRREVPLARERAEAVMTLSTERGFPYWLASGTRVRGWALAEQGQVQEGIAQMRQSSSPYLLALLAEAYGKAGQAEEGLNVLAEALARMEKTGESVYEAELYRLKGTLTLQSQTSLGQVSGKSQASPKQVESKSRTSQGQAEYKSEIINPRPLTLDSQGEAEAFFLKAIDIARQQQAKSWELRATVSLARLWQQQGKKRQAHNLLSEIYHWFTEGFDTKDLQEAKALIEDLGEKVKRGNGKTGEKRTS